MASKQPTPTVRELVGDVAPKLTELTEDILFGDVWERPGLSKRDRSLITVCALVGLNRTEQLPFHLRRALENGISKGELIEAITHLAFYSGWPTAMSVVLLAREVFREEEIAGGVLSLARERISLGSGEKESHGTRRPKEKS